MSNGAQIREDELPEFPVQILQGICSELPLDDKETIGLDDQLNLVTLRGALSTRSGLNLDNQPPLLPDGTSEPVQGFASFYTPNGTFVTAAITATRLLQWDGTSQSWISIAGTLANSPNLFQAAVVAKKLLFSQGVDQVQMWDGVSGTFGPASANAYPAYFLSEYNRRLLAAYTLENGSYFPQRLRWTGISDPTDWTSFLAGAYDMDNDLGPISGVIKLYQSAFLFQYLGITQMQETGNFGNPFAFTGLSAHSKGNICPYSLAPFGEDFAPYVGGDNVYVFNGNSSEPIGDYRVDGGKSGAKRRIYAELQLSDLQSVFGLTSSSIAGEPFNAYWLFIPGGSTWMFSLSDNLWFRFDWSQTPVNAGLLSKATAPTFLDLIGPMISQTWTSQSIADANPLNNVVISFSDGSIGLVDLTATIERPWSFRTGVVKIGDKRHQKAIKKVCLVLQDTGVSRFKITITNEKGDMQSQTITTVPTNGWPINMVLAFSITGMYFIITVEGAPDVAGNYTDISLNYLGLVYTPSGEQPHYASPTNIRVGKAYPS